MFFSMFLTWFCHLGYWNLLTPRLVDLGGLGGMEIHPSALRRILLGDSNPQPFFLPCSSIMGCPFPFLC